MTRMQWRRSMRWVGGAAALTTLSALALLGVSWARYGQVAAPTPEEADVLLDHFMPDYEVVDRHSVRVAAPADVALRAAVETDFQQSAMVRTIVRAREVLLGATPGPEMPPSGLLEQMRSLGWRVLAETPGREVVVGAVTQPWLPNVVFRGIPSEEFRAFEEPGYVKIVWTLRADPVGERQSIVRSETRVATTDPVARNKFRWYWARVSPGIILIRRGIFRVVKTEAERRARS